MLLPLRTEHNKTLGKGKNQSERRQQNRTIQKASRTDRHRSASRSP
jgi:hypothetical protein